MEPGESLIVTPGAILGLFYLQRYRFLTITQVTRVTGLSYHHTADLLRGFAAPGAMSATSAMCASPATARPPRPTTSSAKVGWASPLGVEGLLTNPNTPGGGYGRKTKPTSVHGGI
jgi:hypothetical protein